MFHTSNKHQPNWLKLARYSYCIISYPNVLSDRRFLVSMATGTSHILLGYENMWFFAYKIKFIYLTRVRFLGSAPKSILILFKMSQRCINVLKMYL